MDENQERENERFKSNYNFELKNFEQKIEFVNTTLKSNLIST